MMTLTLNCFFEYPKKKSQPHLDKNLDGFMGGYCSMWHYARSNPRLYHSSVSLNHFPDPEYTKKNSGILDSRDRFMDIIPLYYYSYTTRAANRWQWGWFEFKSLYKPVSARKQFFLIHGMPDHGLMNGSKESGTKTYFYS
jgi:hypothetical protein